jgi:hypothetical protein
MPGWTHGLVFYHEMPRTPMTGCQPSRQESSPSGAVVAHGCMHRPLALPQGLLLSLMFMAQVR